MYSIMWAQTPAHWWKFDLERTGPVYLLWRLLSSWDLEKKENNKQRKYFLCTDRSTSQGIIFGIPCPTQGTDNYTFPCLKRGCPRKSPFLPLQLHDFVCLRSNAWKRELMYHSYCSQAFMASRVVNSYVQFRQLSEHVARPTTQGRCIRRAVDASAVQFTDAICSVFIIERYTAGMHQTGMRTCADHVSKEDMVAGRLECSWTTQAKCSPQSRASHEHSDEDKGDAHLVTNLRKTVGIASWVPRKIWIMWIWSWSPLGSFQSMVHVQAYSQTPRPQTLCVFSFVSSTPKLPSSKHTFSQQFDQKMYCHLSSEKAMKLQVLHTVWRNISGEAAGEIWNWTLLVVKMC